MDKLTFMRSSPREIDGILSFRQKRSLLPAALICCTLRNINRDPEKRPEPYTVEDFLGEGGEEELSDEEFMEKVMRGESFDFDPDAVAGFRRQMEAMFSTGPSKVTTEGPRGKERRS